MTTLPIPGVEDAKRSTNLLQCLKQEIADGKGWISFARYMERVLYHPDWGYYSHKDTVLGPAGDFVTAPETSPLFGHSLAQQIAQVLDAFEGSIIELGAGTGKLACDLLDELGRLHALPRSYLILEISPRLKRLQQHRLASHPLHALVQWTQRLPQNMQAVVLANEVFDALPVHLVINKNGQFLEQGVTFARGRLDWSDRVLNPGQLQQAACELNPGPDYRIEINLEAKAWIERLAASLSRGILLLMDYGFSTREYYHPQRNLGTLMCHYRHHVLQDPLCSPGLQDITCHVDFGALARKGLKCHLQLLGFTSQAQFLINCGMMQILTRYNAKDPKAYLPLTSQVKKLLDPSEMGELVKVMALGKNVEFPLLGFQSGDRGHLLLENL
jgi:SAM-dependent MidA family methyltransferase